MNGFFHQQYQAARRGDWPSEPRTQRVFERSKQASGVRGVVFAWHGVRQCRNGLLRSRTRFVRGMINMQLSDMTGLELYQLLQPRLEKTPVIMVDDHYDAVREVSVLAVGHPYYAWKPLDGSWVGKLRPETL